MKVFERFVELTALPGFRSLTFRGFFRALAVSSTRHFAGFAIQSLNESFQTTVIPSRRFREA